MIKEMTKILMLIVGIWLSSLHLAAQQTPQWTQYILNQYTINPAYAGLDRSLSITAGIRSQWSNFDGAPQTQVLNAHLPLYYLNGAAGVMLTNDVAGLIRRTAFTGSYNYVQVSSIGLLSIGVRAGIQQVRLDGAAIVTPDGTYTDGVIDHDDPILLTTVTTGFSPIWSIGGYFTKDAISIGLTMDNIGNNISAGGTQLSEDQVFTLLGSYKLSLTEDLMIQPSLLYKTDFTLSQLDIGVLAHYQQFFAGLSLRGYHADNLDALGVLAGVKVSEKVRISYSFDIGLSDLAPQQEGSHEFLFNYNLNRPIKTGEPPKIIYNPRYN